MIAALTQQIQTKEEKRTTRSLAVSFLKFFRACRRPVLAPPPALRAPSPKNGGRMARRCAVGLFGVPYGQPADAGQAPTIPHALRLWVKANFSISCQKFGKHSVRAYICGAEYMKYAHSTYSHTQISIVGRGSKPQ